MPTPLHRQADGSATSADAEGGIRAGRFDLKNCDDKRQLLLDAWPRAMRPADPRHPAR